MIYRSYKEKKAEGVMEALGEANLTASSDKDQVIFIIKSIALSICRWRINYLNNNNNFKQHNKLFLMKGAFEKSKGVTI